MTIDERVKLLESEVKVLSEQVTILSKQAIKLADSTSKLIDASRMIKECIEKHIVMHLLKATECEERQDNVRFGR